MILKMEGISFSNKGFLVVVLLLLLVVLACGHGLQGKGTCVGFYSRTCPQAESIVRRTVESHVKANPTLAAVLLRIHFHDCFVRGCDASLLIEGDKTEREAGPNLNLKPGYKVIDDAKAKLEAACPGVVSCADILALAARDSVVLSGGLSWLVPTGRRDGRVSIGSEAFTLPGPNDTVQQQKDKYAKKGLSAEDLVILSGGHTIGTTACQFFADRIYNSNGTDRSISPSFLPTLRQLCPQNQPTKRIALDTGSQFRFDTSYYNNLKNGRGILRSDQVLWTDPSTRGYVQKYLAAGPFNVQFGRSMVKMGHIELKTGTNGEIRKICSAVN